jgi:hypothetical protein
LNYIEFFKTDRNLQSHLFCPQLHFTCNSENPLILAPLIIFQQNLKHKSCKVKKIVPIICFKIKNPPTVHSTSKIRPTTSPTFVFSVSASVRIKWSYERKLLDSRVGRSSSCFLFILLFHSKSMIW